MREAIKNVYEAARNNNWTVEQTNNELSRICGLYTHIVDGLFAIVQDKQQFCQNTDWARDEIHRILS